jgi:transcriptional regulator, arsr family
LTNIKNICLRKEPAMPKKDLMTENDAIHPDKVDEVLNKMSGAEEYILLTKFFKIFADETRLKIIAALSISELCVLDICAVLNMTKSAVSHQLSTLRQMRVVKSRKEGRSVFYSLDDEHVSQVFEMGLAHIVHTKGKGEEEDEKSL